MKKIVVYLVDNSIPFYFAKVANETNETTNGVTVNYVNETQASELVELASSEGLAVQVRNGLIISEPEQKKKAVTDPSGSVAAKKAAPKKPEKKAAPKKKGGR